MPLGGDLDGRRSQYPTSLISWLDGQPDITPADPGSGRASWVGRSPWCTRCRPSGWRNCRACSTAAAGSEEILAGPLAAEVRSRWSQVVGSPEVLTHGDYWSGNVVWRDGRLTGIVDWSGGSRGPRGFDLGWCRLDLVLLFDEQIADEFLAAYEAGSGEAVDEIRLWDCWAVARSHDAVASWAPNYRPLGRADLDEDELRRRHAQWAARIRAQA